jgi:hypothetical protein
LNEERMIARQTALIPTASGLEIRNMGVEPTRSLLMVRRARLVGVADLQAVGQGVPAARPSGEDFLMMR